MEGTRTVLLLGAVAVGATGCFEPPAEAIARLEQVKADAEELESAMSTLEERFLGNEYQVLHWSELARRHRHVSAIACENHSEHFAKMAAHFEKTNQRARMLKRRRNVANAKAVGRGGMGGPDDGKADD